VYCCSRWSQGPLQRETLQVAYKGHTIAEVLQMTWRAGLPMCFRRSPRRRIRLRTLVMWAGLQSSSVNRPPPSSGGEAQRVKLATELSKRATGKTLYLSTRPTTGLSFYDVHKLMDVMQRRWTRAIRSW